MAPTLWYWTLESEVESRWIIDIKVTWKVEVEVEVMRKWKNEKLKRLPRSLLEIWAIYTEFLPSSQTIPALPTASNARSKEKKTFYSVSWIKRQWHAVDYI